MRKDIYPAEGTRKIRKAEHGLADQNVVSYTKPKGKLTTAAYKYGFLMFFFLSETQWTRSPSHLDAEL